MYSNIITPPDFIDDSFHTITVVGADEESIAQLVDYCRYADISYNVYLCNNKVDNPEWLQEAVRRSQSVILFDDENSNRELLQLPNSYYIGDKSYVCPSSKIKSILDYFAI